MPDKFYGPRIETLRAAPACSRLPGVEYLERWRAHMLDPEFIGIVCDHVASGGSLIALCRTLDLKYANVIAWVHRDPERDKQYKDAIAARAEWAMERVLQEIQLIGTVDIRRAYDQSGALLPVNQMPDDVAVAVASVEVDELYEGFGRDREHIGETKKLKLIDKLKALELMGKNFGMFIDRHEIDIGKQTLEALVSGSMPALPEATPIETTADQPTP